MTPQEVLDVLAEIREAEIAAEDTDDSGPLRFETTIRNWDNASGNDWMVSWPHGLGSWLNDVFGTDFTRAEWRSLLRHSRTRTLRDLCEFIAPRTRVPEAGPCALFGRSCREAGVFLAIRSLLRSADVGVDHLAPSTPLKHFAVDGFPRIWAVATRRWPGIIRLACPQRRGEAGHILAAITMFIGTVVLGVLTVDRLWYGMAALGSFAAFISIWIHSVRRQATPAEVYFAVEIYTFADLARKLFRDAGVPREPAPN